MGNDESVSYSDINGTIFEEFQSAQYSLVSSGQFDDLNLCQLAASHAPEVDCFPYETPFLNEPILNDRLLLPLCATSYLWQEFNQSIAPGIIIDNRQQNNLVTKYFTSNAAGRPSLFSAIIFLSYSIKLNWIIQRPLLIDMADVTTAALKMEQQAISYIRDVMSRDADQPTGPQVQESSKMSPNQMITLSTLVALCFAYIAANNLQSLRACLGHAMRITREGFTTELATDDEFLFLVRLLGYIHIVALLDETDYSIDVPNYFCITSEPDHSSSTQGKFFLDVEPFFGISVSVADLLYRIGRLLRKRKNNPTASLSELCKSDASCVEVETRLQLLLRRLENHKKDDKELHCHLDLYNESLLYSGFLRFLLEFKEEPYNSPLVQSAVTQVLDSCAAVPAGTSVANLMLLPLFTAGSLTTRPLHHDFIRRRLEVLKSGQCIVNVTRLEEILEERWQDQKRPGSDQNSFVYAFSGMSQPSPPGLELKSASVCVLF